MLNQNKIDFVNIFFFIIYIMASFCTKTFQKHDDYMTPKHAWDDIKQYIPEEYKTIYEPFYGDGKSGENLKQIFSDKTIIHNNVDFYEYVTIYNYDAILSNPPFSDAKKIFRIFRR